MKTINKENKKASVLVFTIFIMMITLIAGLNVITISTTERRSALATGKSINSFQVAESGLEVALAGMKDRGNSLNAIDGCSDGEVSGTVNNGTFKITFYSDEEGNNQITDCGAGVVDVKSVKSIGEYAGARRAVKLKIMEVIPEG